MPEPSPAPDCTCTLWPRSVSSRTPDGVSATRYSSALISDGTPTFTGCSQSSRWWWGGRSPAPASTATAAAAATTAVGVPFGVPLGVPHDGLARQLQRSRKVGVGVPQRPDPEQRHHPRPVGGRPRLDDAVGAEALVASVNLS